MNIVRKNAFLLCTVTISSPRKGTLIAFEDTGNSLEPLIASVVRWDRV